MDLLLETSEKIYHLPPNQYLGFEIQRAGSGLNLYLKYAGGVAGVRIENESDVFNFASELRTTIKEGGECFHKGTWSAGS